jgi:hypothetical protein
MIVWELCESKMGFGEKFALFVSENGSPKFDIGSDRLIKVWFIEAKACFGIVTV